jgi:hypothetical protein
MSAEARCWECRRLVSQDELEVGQDGRPMCCCCRLKESGEKLAEKERDERSAQTVKETAKVAANVAAPFRDLPPPEPDQGEWTGLY